MSTTAPPAVTPDLNALALQLVALRHLLDRARAESDSRKAAFLAALGAGSSKRVYVQVDGREVEAGHVSADRIKRVAQVIDRSALEKWCSEHVTGAVSTDVVITDQAAAMAVLAEHAPHLLEDVTSVASWAIANALRQAEAEDKAGNPVTPSGIQVADAAPVVKVAPNKAATDAVWGLLRDGAINVDTSLALPGGAA